MHYRPLFFAFLLTIPALLLQYCSMRTTRSIAADRERCPVTKPSEHPFVPPAPYSSIAGGGEYLYGSPALWTIVRPDWHLNTGVKMPFWREGYDWRKEGRPHLTVVARRLNAEGPLVWNGLATSGFTDASLASTFMVTGIDIPAPGCWEIAAQYTDDPGNIGALSYTVWVKP